MGIFVGFIGNASEVSAAEAQREYANILANGEFVDMAYKLIRDMFLFTNMRLILVDKQGLTRKKVEYH
ncbi:MAG: PH domain-containing protein [Brevibacillus sp.]|nr:PH domain-containing protein [Brevibacillus sp.]